MTSFEESLRLAVGQSNETQQQPVANFTKMLAENIAIKQNLFVEDSE